jgi:hypothetical protein
MIIPNRIPQTHSPHSAGAVNNAFNAGWMSVPQKW